MVETQGSKFCMGRTAKSIVITRSWRVGVVLGRDARKHAVLSRVPYMDRNGTYAASSKGLQDMKSIATEENRTEESAGKSRK